MSGLSIRRCHELWCRLAAVAPIQPLAWEPLYAAGVAPKKTRKKKKKISFPNFSYWCGLVWMVLSLKQILKAVIIAFIVVFYVNVLHGRALNRPSIVMGL